MATHVIDFLTLGNNFGTPEMRAVWSEENRLRQQIEVEVALAKVEGELGVIPAEAAEKIAKSVDANVLDFNQLADEAVKLKHTFMATINALQRQSGEAGEYIHYGATTQDIVDTATALQLKQAFDIVQRDSRLVAQALKQLAKKYQYLPMVGRTHGDRKSVV